VSLEIANTIIDQIKTTDRWALPRWGVLPKKTFVVKADKHLGGVTMDTIQKLRIEITLDYSDTYRVRVYNVRKKELVKMSEIDDVYCDELVSRIDALMNAAWETLGL